MRRLKSRAQTRNQAPDLSIQGKVQINLRIGSDELAALRSKAEAMRVTLSAYIRSACAIANPEDVAEHATNDGDEGGA